jgi:guanylate kinase
MNNMQIQDKPLLIVISGPAGVGKDSVIHMMKEIGIPFHFVVTATSRPPRPGEVHGADYFFYSKGEFEQMLADGEFIEHADVYGQYKGVPRSQVKSALESGKDVVMRVDVQGAATIKQKFPDALLVFLMLDEIEDLVNRLRERNTDTEDQLKIRIELARHEYSQIPGFDYQVCNRDGHLEDTARTIEAIIKAEHHRTDHREVSL